MSIEHKLPLLITALLAVVLLAGLGAAYNEVRRSSIDVAGERLQRVSQQIAVAISPTVPARLQTLAGVGRNPAIAAFLTSPSPSTQGAALEALAVLASAAGQPEVPVLILRADRTVALVDGDLPADLLANSLEVPSNLPDSVGVGDFFQVDTTGKFWLTAPAVDGDTIVGYIAELRPVGGAAAAQQLESLLGDNISVVLANREAGPWIGLSGERETVPDEWPFLGTSSYDHDDGAELGHATPVPNTRWSVIAEEPMAVVLARPNEFLRRSIIIRLLLCVLGGLAAWWLSRTLTVPLRDLRLASEGVARGDYQRRIDVTRGDEMGVLAEAFNTMASRVEHAHEDLTEQYEEAQALAEELEQTNEELAAAVAEADTANRAKSEFLATMSHEIRTPINAIIGYTDLIQMGLSGPITPEQEAHLERVRASGRHLVGLVDQVLDFARIEAGSLRVDREVASATDAIEIAVTVLRPQAELKGVEISVAEGDLRYLGDPQRVGQVLVNLLSNSIKFTQPGGRTSVHCESRECALPGGTVAGSWTCLVVEDTGLGISTEKLEEIFEPFVQVETGYTRSHEGTGLGLAISLGLARAMGGELTVDSEIEKGSRFTLWLPAPKQSTLAAPTPAG